MSNLTKAVDNAILTIRQQENECIVREYNEKMKYAKEHAERGIIGYDAWLLKHPEKQESYLEETWLIRDFKEKLQGDTLIDVTSEEIERAWKLIANYEWHLGRAKKMAQTYYFLKWDDNWEKEIIEKGRKGILSSLIADATHYGEYAAAIFEKGYSQPINCFRTDLIIKKEVVKKYTGEMPADFAGKIDGSIKRLQELEDAASRIKAAENYKDRIKWSEIAAENGKYEIPVWSKNIEINHDNFTAVIKNSKGLWRRIADYESNLKEADQIAKRYPDIAVSHKEIKSRIKRIGRLNIVCKMAMDIEERKKYASSLCNDSDRSRDEIGKLTALKEIFKLLEEGKI